jgi:hypothetical protein
MRYLLLRIFFLAVLLTGLFLPSETLFASGAPSDHLLAPDNQVVATPTPTPVPDSKSPETEPISIENSVLTAFIQVPPNIVDQPYVILSAVELGTSSTSIEIRGSISDRVFVCASTPCTVPFSQSNRINFTAYSSSGHASEEVVASVTVALADDGYTVSISSVSQYTTFIDSCGTIWNRPPYEETPLWAEFSQFPFELNTQRTLHYLSTKLILSGIVDASSCRAGGLNNDLTWPSGCGLEQARSTVIEWQNCLPSKVNGQI